MIFQSGVAKCGEKARASQYRQMEQGGRQRIAMVIWTGTLCHGDGRPFWNLPDIRHLVAQPENEVRRGLHGAHRSQCRIQHRDGGVAEIGAEGRRVSLAPLAVRGRVAPRRVRVVNVPYDGKMAVKTSNQHDIGQF